MKTTEERALEDFKVFLWLVWKFLGLPEPTPLQYDIAEFLQGNVGKRKVIQAFRGIGKSYITSAYVIWRLFRDPEENILVVSASKDRSDAFSRFTKMVIHEMPLVKHLEPRHGHGFDSIEKFTVGTAPVSQSPSVKSVGLYGMITGTRADVIVADDVEVPNNSETATQREKLAERVKEFAAILKPDDDSGGARHEVIFLGTPQNEDSLYNKLPSRGYTVRNWPARVPSEAQLHKYGDGLTPVIHERSLKGESEWGKPTDIRFDEIELQEREGEYGRTGFSLQFMLDTALSDMDRYPLKCRDMIVFDTDCDIAPEKMVWGSGQQQIVNDIPMIGLPGDRFHTRMEVDGEKWLPYSGSVMAVDPSGRGKDETGYVVVKMLHGQLFVRKCGGFRGGYDSKTLTKLAHIAKEEKVQMIIVEPNFGDGMFVELFKPIIRDIHRCSIEDAPRSVHQKEARIINVLEPLLNQHRLIFDREMLKHDVTYQDETDNNYIHRKLVHQLTRITRDRGALKHDDRIDPLAMACQYWVDQIAVSVDEQMLEHRSDLLEKDLEKFRDNVFNLKGRRNQKTWLTPMGI